MSMNECFEDLKTLIKSLICDVQEVKNELIEARNDINILKLELKELKENNKNKDKKIDKKLIEKEMVRIGKKHIDQEKIVIESGSMNDEFRKYMLPKILEEELELQKSIEKTLGKLKIEEKEDKQDKKDE